MRRIDLSSKRVRSARNGNGTHSKGDDKSRADAACDAAGSE